MKIATQDDRKSQLKKLEEIMGQRADAKLYVWGCASTAGMITDYLVQNASLEVAAYIVDDAYYKDDTYHNRSVLKASDWEKLAKEGDCVVMGFTSEERAKRMLSGLKEGVCGFYFYFPYSSNAYGTCLTYEEYLAHEEEFRQVYGMLADQCSKDTMEAFLNGCISGNVEKLNELKAEGQYFNELTRNYPVGCFVDCGAYTGDTLEAVHDFYGDTLQRIVALEPDEKNVELLKKRVKGCNLREEQLCLFTMGSWSKREQLRFSSDNSSSSINEQGDIIIEVDCLDHLLKQVKEPVGYIKMDVEGSEKESLLGAAETIRNAHPILAVCVYHKPEDLYELTQTITDLSQGYPYQFYLRYYGPDLRELVLYALPGEIQK